jgi:hypothetical protein
MLEIRIDENGERSWNGSSAAFRAPGRPRSGVLITSAPAVNR